MDREECNRPPADTWLDHLETETRSRTRTGLGPFRLEVVTLTLLAHPDPQRVGDLVALPELSVGGEIELSRLRPALSAPHGGEGRPLADPRLSRRPIWLRSMPYGGLCVDASETKTRCWIDGEPVDGPRELSREDVARGAVLLLGERVALLLHHSLPSTERPPELGLIGESDGVSRLRREIRRVADVEVPVLLRGESGTGKELAARAIHDASLRRSGPFVAINIGAVPPTLAAAELFGAARGAFSGADRRRQGYFQRAHGGTLFLDEIGETPPEIQVLLLRALESGEVQPVGVEAPQEVDVRVVAATDADLEAAAAAGRFKTPLLHRLGGYEILLPPLRERREDIGRLFFFFLRQELAAVGEPERLVSRGPHGRPWVPAELVARLAAYDWPGNVRQLRNVVRQLAVASRGAAELEPGSRLEKLLAMDADRRPAIGGESAVPPAPGSSDSAAVSYRDPADIGEDELVEALRAHRFEPKGTAEALGVSRTSLYALIDRCPRVRKASELGRDEIESTAKRHAGRLDAMAGDLEVSRQGLKRRMKVLGLR